MVAQMNLFENTIYSFLAYKKEKERKSVKRIRAKYPSYQKVYSVYRYDHYKYRELWKPIIKQALEDDDPGVYWKVNPYDLINKCCLKDKEGKRKKFDDEKHIYRYKTLYKLYEAIGFYLFKGQMKLELGEDYY